MSSLYDRFANTASNLIGKFGQPVTIERVTGGTGPRGGPVSTETFSTTGVRFEFEAALVDGTFIRQGDFSLSIPAKGAKFEPRAGDFVTVDGVRYSIATVKPLKPASTGIMHDLQCRKT